MIDTDGRHARLSFIPPFRSPPTNLHHAHYTTMHPLPKDLLLYSHLPKLIFMNSDAPPPRRAAGTIGSSLTFLRGHTLLALCAPQVLTSRHVIMIVR